ACDGVAHGDGEGRLVEGHAVVVCPELCVELGAKSVLLVRVGCDVKVAEDAVGVVAAVPVAVEEFAGAVGGVEGGGGESGMGAGSRWRCVCVRAVSSLLSRLRWTCSPVP